MYLQMYYHSIADWNYMYMYKCIRCVEDILTMVQPSTSAKVQGIVTSAFKKRKCQSLVKVVPVHTVTLAPVVISIFTNHGVVKATPAPPHSAAWEVVHLSIETDDSHLVVAVVSRYSWSMLIRD